MSESLTSNKQAISQWSGEFVSQQDEQAYLDEHWANLAQQLRIVCVIGAIAYLSGLYINLNTLHSVSSIYIMGVLRGMVAALLFIVVLCSFSDHINNKIRFWLLIAELFFGISETMEFHLHVMESGFVPMIDTPFILFLILLFYTIFPNRVVLTLIGSVIAGLMLPLYLILFTDAVLLDITTQLLFLTVVNVTGLAIQRSWNRSSRLDFIHQIHLQREISERKKAQATALLAKEEADKANQAKSLFLAKVNHELRTPLQGVIVGLELLNDSMLSTEQRKLLTIVNSSGRQLESIIENVLDLARIETGQLELAIEDFNLHELLSDIDSILRYHVGKDNLNFSVTLDDEVPILLRGDPTRLKQLLLNLGANAIKFTEQGKVAITVKLLQQSDHIVQLHFCISDSGIGLSDEEQAIIFSPFSQADNSSRRHYGGSGLGLAICHELVTAMGGTIEVKSTPEKGSRFFFDLEFSPGNSQTITPAAPAPERLTTCSLLLVEDVEANRVLTTLLLKSMGHQVVEADSGAQALALAEFGGFDVILMDLHMPYLDGIETTRKIQSLSNPECAEIPIIALSADKQQATINACLSSGMQAFVAKPFNRKHLQQALANVLIANDDAISLSQMAYGTEIEADTTQLVDKDYLMKICSDLGIKQYRQVIGSCVNSLSQLKGDLEIALQAADWPRFARATHQLKGVSGNYRLQILHQQIYLLECALENEEYELLQPLTNELNIIVEKAVSLLRKTEEAV
ncbi:ATP-binding protein [Pseudomonadota bacterium]